MWKRKIDKMPYCIDCKHECTLKTKLIDNSKKKSYDFSAGYCDFFDELLDINDHFNKCNGYEKKNANEEKIVVVDIERFKQYYKKHNL